MTNPHEKPVRDRPKYILLTPLSAKVLSVVAIGAIYLWFVLKFFLSGGSARLTTCRRGIGASGLLRIDCDVSVYLRLSCQFSR